MENKEILRKLNNIMEDLESLVNRVWSLEKELSESQRMQCQCDVEYNGSHTWPCKAKR